jgi:anion-transporting  ArsA/GET3 family ATPase
VSSSSLLDSRLLMVTGKGGVGKTTFAASLARLKAAKGQRTVLCEIDAQRPAMGSIFNCEVGYKPTEVSERLSVCNLTWTEALVTYLQRSLPVSGLVRRILDNEVVNRFLDFTPGSRELAILSRVGQLVESYDAVVIESDPCVNGPMN